MGVETVEIESAGTIIGLALAEDLQDRGDITSAATIDAGTTADVQVVARQSGVLSGAVLLNPVYQRLAARSPGRAPCEVSLHVQDGAEVTPGSQIATIHGSVRQLLSGERTALNFLSHLSGIASTTAAFVRRVRGTGAVILDTRKTLPGYRQLQKYAVRCGGGKNHRMGLYDGMLIKDNHLAASQGRTVADAVATARRFLQDEAITVPVEVEVDTLQQLKDALQGNPEIVLLDNMKPATLQEAVRIRDQISPETLLEASGGITLESVGCVAGAGVDRISIGSLTHSAPALDIGFDWPAGPSDRET
jgi:nicotinate-nucleotide pyrophosphorylase (carboxylating)